MAESVIKKENAALFITRGYSASYSLTEGQAKGVTGNDANYTAPPAGYTPVGLKMFNADSNNAYVRYVNAGGYGSGTLYVVRNITNGTITGTCTIKILFARNDVVGT